MNTASWQRMWYIAYKEMLHIVRDPQTLFFTLFIPIAEMFLLGYAIDTNVRHVRTVVVDFAGTQESREFIQRFENSQDFDVVMRCFSEEQANRAIVAGKAQVGIIIPRDYSRNIESGQTASFLILVDGTVSSIAAEAVNVGNALAMRESLERALGGKPLPVEARPRVLFNPDTRSPNFFLPGLMVIVCQIMATILSATAIVREKEFGTLEQFYMTPVRRGEMILGKMLPYVILTTMEFCLVALIMARDLSGPDSRLFRQPVGLVAAVHVDDVGLRAADFHQGRHARRRHADGDGHDSSLDFSLRLRVPARFDAGGVPGLRPFRPGNVADRRSARHYPFRGVSRLVAIIWVTLVAPVWAMAITVMTVKRRVWFTQAC